MKLLSFFLLLFFILFIYSKKKQRINENTLNRVYIEYLVKPKSILNFLFIYLFTFFVILYMLCRSR